MAVEEPGAGVPAQPRIVVARRAQPFGAFEVPHGFDDPVVGPDARAGAAVRELRLRAPLGDDPGAVRLVVFAFERRQRLARALVRVGCGAELIGEREQQRDERGLIVGVDREDVEADALGFARLVEEAVPLGLRQGGVDGVTRERLEFAHPWLLPPADTISASAAAGKRAAGGDPRGEGVIAAPTPGAARTRPPRRRKPSTKLVV